MTNAFSTGNRNAAESLVEHKYQILSIGMPLSERLSVTLTLESVIFKIPKVPFPIIFGLAMTLTF